MSRILVIKPNSSASVSAAIDAAEQPWRLAGGPTITVAGLASGPLGIATQRDADVVVMECAGMAAHRRAIADEIGCPVVEPSQPAVTAAIGALLLNRAEAGE